MLCNRMMACVKLVFLNSNTFFRFILLAVWATRSSISNLFRTFFYLSTFFLFCLWIFELKSVNSVVSFNFIIYEFWQSFNIINVLTKLILSHSTSHFIRFILFLLQMTVFFCGYFGSLWFCRWCYLLFFWTFCNLCFRFFQIWNGRIFLFHNSNFLNVVKLTFLSSYTLMMFL